MIAHVDADSFFASVLQRKNPRLRGKPLLALGMGGTCVIAASYEAKDKGVRTGMPLREALKLCPEALCEPSDFRETALASDQIESILKDEAPFIEQMSIDEWYLDLASRVGGIPENLHTWAQGVQAHIQRSTGLSVSVGVGPSKLLAKMASEYHKPSGVSIVTHTSSRFRGGTTAPDPSAIPLTIEEFLRDRPAAAIPGIGRRRQVHTTARKWLTAWDIAKADRAEVSQLFGKNGRDMQRELLGACLSPVAQSTAAPKSVSRARSFRATRDLTQLWAHLLHHLTYTTLRMRRKSLTAQGISVWLRDGEYHYQSTHLRFGIPLDTEETILPYLTRCFRDLFHPRRAYTQAGMGLWDLGPRGSQQLSLLQPPEEHVRERSVQRSLDRIRNRFGRDVIGRGAAMPVSRRRALELDVSVFE